MEIGQPAPADTPVPPADTPVPPADTPVPPADTPTFTPVPPANTPTFTPVPPTNTPTFTPVPPPPPEDCISFDYQRAEVKQINGRWKIVEDNHWIMDFGSSEVEARAALDIIKHYRMTEYCFVGRPDPSMEYFLVNGGAPAGSFTGEDCVGFNPEKIEVTNIDGRWKIVEGSHWIMDFEDKEDEARMAFAIIKKYGFRNICFVGRPNASMTYFRR